MPEIKNTFSQGKMNKDLDERIIPSGQYRDARNVQISTSEGSDVGTAQTQTLNGTTSSWTGLDIGNKPNWTQTVTGQPFQFTEHYVAPGLQTHTLINRTQTIQSVTTSTSIFSQ